MENGGSPGRAGIPSPFFYPGKRPARRTPHSLSPGEAVSLNMLQGPLPEREWENIPGEFADPLRAEKQLGEFLARGGDGLPAADQREPSVLLCHRDIILSLIHI